MVGVDRSSVYVPGVWVEYSSIGMFTAVASSCVGVCVYLSYHAVYAVLGINGYHLPVPGEIRRSIFRHNFGRKVVLLSEKIVRRFQCRT